MAIISPFIGSLTNFSLLIIDNRYIDAEGYQNDPEKDEQDTDMFLTNDDTEGEEKRRMPIDIRRYYSLDGYGMFVDHSVACSISSFCPPKLMISFEMDLILFDCLVY